MATGQGKLDVVIMGLGRVGRAVAEQLQAAMPLLLSRYGVCVRIIGVADQSGILLHPAGFPPSTMRHVLETKSHGKALSTMPQTSATLDLPWACELATSATHDGARIVFVDATADPELADMWKAVLAAGGAVVLANKLPLSAHWGVSGPLFAHPRLRYEATVGAGLPVISTLRALHDSGDRVTHIRASVSGTLAFLLARAMAGETFSAAVREAVSAGYAEPDPREDLRGSDVARKGLILARALDWPAEPEDVEVESLVCEQPDEASATGLGRMSSLDEAMSERVGLAVDRGRVLRYIVSVSPEEQTIRAGIAALDRSDPFSASGGTENRIEIRSRSYGDDALTLCGPGAGPRVTAMGVLSDLVDLARLSHKEGE